MTNRMRERGQHVLKTREYWQQRMKKKLAGAQMELPRSPVLPENRQTQTESSAQFVRQSSEPGRLCGMLRIRYVYRSSSGRKFLPLLFRMRGIRKR